MEIGVTFLVVGFCVITFLAIRVAYRHGVRDGYQNNHLPHIRKQIRDEKLEQYWTDTSDWKDDEE